MARRDYSSLALLPMNDSAKSLALGMSQQEFQDNAATVAAWAAEYLSEAMSLPVLSATQPGEIARRLPASAPEEGEPFEAIFSDLREIVLPGITHWNHPGFFAYFGISSPPIGILAEAIIATLNVNAMLWRTSPAATELEGVATDWLRRMIGLPDQFRGHIQDTASTSTLVAIATARENLGLQIRDQGLAGRDLPPLRMYCSEEAHSSVEKAGITLGVGRSGVSRIPTDDRFRMRSDLLEQAILEDLEAGMTPFCIVASIGTTSTTSVDPIPEVVEIARRFGLWLHIDAAYGGAAAIIPEMRHLMNGWEDADSIVVNPHKWLFVPIDCSTLYLRRPELTKRAFSLIPDYLVTPEGDSVTNLMDYGPALGRRFRSLKLWMTMRHFGRAELARRIARHITLASGFASGVEAAEGWELVAPVLFSTVCFRYSPPGLAGEDLDRLNEELVRRVNQSGEVFLAGTRLRGRFTIRLAIGNIRTKQEHVDRAWELLMEAAAGI